MKIDLNRISEIVLQFSLNFLAAVIIFVVGKWIAKIISRIAHDLMTKSKINHTLAAFAKNIIYFGILTFVVIAALNKMGVETTSFIAVIGAAGLAIGLALQGSLSNFSAGVMLILLHPFQVGDTIEAGGAAGTVEEIQIFNTIIISADNKKIIIPNSKITGDKIIIISRKK